MALQSLDELISKAHMKTDLDQSVIESWCDTYQYEGYDVVDRYWVDLPFVFAEVHYNKTHDSYRYTIHQPDIESELTTQTDTIKDVVDISREPIENSSYSDLASMISTIACVTNQIDPVSLVEAYCIAHMLKIQEHPLGEIRGVVADQNISSVDCSGDQAKLRVYHHEYKHMPSNISLSTAEIRNYVEDVQNQTDMAENEFSVNLDSKTVFFGHDGELSDTVSFSIQSYNRGNVSPVELIQSGMFSADEMGYLWETMSYGGNIVVGGGTHVGKSITLNAIGNFIPVNQRVVSVEEQREVELDHPYWTPMTSDEETPIPEVIKKSLRVRPDYVLFDEIRSEDESNVLFEAAMTGHSIVFTMHAPSVEECLTRLSLPPIDISGSHLSTIDVIIGLSEYTKDGDSINRCSEIVEPAENWNGELDTLSTASICEWDSHTDTHTADPSESILLREIAESQLTSGETIVQRIMLRSDILSYMAEEDLDSPSDITDVVAEYDSDPEIQSTISKVGIGEWVAQSINEPESNDNVTSTN